MRKLYMEIHKQFFEQNIDNIKKEQKIDNISLLPENASCRIEANIIGDYTEYYC